MSQTTVRPPVPAYCPECLRRHGTPHTGDCSCLCDAATHPRGGAASPEPVRVNVYVILTADDYAAFGDDHAALESAIAARLEELEAAGGTVRPRVLGVDVEA